MLFELSKTLAAWAVIFPVSFFTGAFFRPLIRINNLLLQGVLIYAAGLAILSNAMILLGAFHAINSAAIWGTLLFFGLLGLRHARYWIEWLKELRDEFRIQNQSLTFRILVLFFFISSAALLLGTLTPETGGDALCYQLNLPKVFLAQGSLTPDSYDYNSYFPLLMNNLYLIGLATGGVMAAKLFHFFAGLLLFLGMKAVVKRYTQSSVLSVFIALTLWVTPTAYNHMASAYVDVGLALHVFLGAVLFLNALEEKKLSSFFLSGLFFGCAVSTKYTAMIAVASAALVWLLNLIKQHDKVVFKGIVVWGIGLFIACGYWLIRNGFETGNPFYPYFGSRFGGEPVAAGNFEKYGTGRSLFDFLSLFWNMFYLPNQFGTFPARIGVFYFLFSPFVVLAAIFRPESRRYALFCLLFLVIIFLIAPADRWLFPILPLIATTAAFGIHGSYQYSSSSMKILMRRVGTFLGIGVLSYYVLAGVYHYRHALPLFTGQWSYDEYARKMERTVPIADWINQNLPQGSKILMELENRQFYFERPIIRDAFLPWPPKDGKGDSARLYQLLKDKGVTHLLARDPVVPDAKIKNQFREILGDRMTVEMIKIPSENIRDEKYRYTLYALR